MPPCSVSGRPPCDILQTCLLTLPVMRYVVRGYAKLPYQSLTAICCADNDDSGHVHVRPRGVRLLSEVTMLK